MHKFDIEMSALSAKKLMRRIFDTIENPPGVIDWECRKSFARYENGVPFLYIGTAVAMYGKELDELDRMSRCILINASWYYLMWFEMAICSLCEGDIQTYNENPIGLPQMKFMFIPKMTETNYKIYEQLY